MFPRYPEVQEMELKYFRQHCTQSVMLALRKKVGEALDGEMRHCKKILDMILVDVIIPFLTFIGAPNAANDDEGGAKKKKKKRPEYS